MAHAYPSITVNGVDVDEDAIAAARHNAEQAGVADRVTLSVANASDLNLSGRYDLVTIFEALHDMSRPVDALRAARELLGADGTVLVVDGFVHDEFTAPASLRERHEYGWSVVSCLPNAMGTPRRPPPEPSCARRCYGGTPWRRASATWRSCPSSPTTGASTG